MRHEKASSGKTSSLVKRSLICLYYPHVRVVVKITLHANYVAKIWRQAKSLILEIGVPHDHGWNEDYPEHVRENNASDTEISDPEYINGTDYSDKEL